MGHYGMLSAQSITQAASLQFEEKQLELWTRKLEERESSQRVLKDRLQSLTELIEAKQQQATQLEQDIITGDRIHQFLELNGNTEQADESDFGEDARRRDALVKARVEQSEEIMAKMMAHRQSMARLALRNLLQGQTMLNAYVQSCRSVASLVEMTDGNHTDAEYDSHLADAVAHHLRAPPGGQTLAQSARSEIRQRLLVHT